MEFIRTAFEQLLELLRRPDIVLNDWAGAMGPWLYVVLFLIVFCETGLVVTPFLPGDSLLFAVGALAAQADSPIRLGVVLAVLLIAAVLGDAVNYAIGYRLGPRVFTERSRFFNRKHLDRAQRFYEKHGGKTIFLARFVPIIRTFAPFVAGIGRMSYRKFAVYNVTGAVAWVTSFLLGGYLFGNFKTVKDNFHIVVAAIIAISLVPVAIEYVRMRREARREREQGLAAGAHEAREER